MGRTDSQSGCCGCFLIEQYLKLRHNITAPALRGCVDQLRVDTAHVVLDRAVGVTDGCPISLLVNNHKCKTRQREDACETYFCSFGSTTT